MDATKRPILINPEFSNYAEKHGVFDIYKRLLQRLLVSLPEDPLKFVVEQLKQEDDDISTVVVLGPPMSGKTTIARKITTDLTHGPLLDAETMLAECSKELRDEAKNYQLKPDALPTELWTRIVKERTSRFDCVRKGWVLDGFPENRDQAQALQAAGVTPKHVVILEAPDSLLIERIEGKRIDPTTKDIYHRIFDWPSDLATQERLVVDSSCTQELVVQRLVRYHRSLDGIAESYHNAYKKINADQPKRDVFAQVQVFLSGQPRSQAPHTPRVLLLGPTGSGKAVQAALVASKYNVVNIAVPNLIQQAIESETPAGLAIRPYTQKGSNAPDHLLLTVVKERLSQMDCLTRGWVIHGYPKTVDQADALDKAGFAPNRVFFLDIPNDSVIERLTLRSTDPITGERYHMLYNPARTAEVKARLKQHPKDADDEVRKRLAAYYSCMEELQEFYAAQAQRINADQDPHTVFECIESMIVNPLPQQFGGTPSAR